jgi:hypothetical protein
MTINRLGCGVLCNGEARLDEYKPFGGEKVEIVFTF